MWFPKRSTAAVLPRSARATGSISTFHKASFRSSRKSNRGYKVLGAKELAIRPDLKKRINELERRRMDLLPSFRILLDQVSSAEAGRFSGNIKS